MERKNLNEIEGVKIRRQYFNVVLCYASVFFLGAILTMMIAELHRGTFDWAKLWPELVDALPLMLGVLVPCAVLSVLNRLLFGEVICVLNERGLHHRNGCIKWSHIQSMTFHVTYFSGRIRFSFHSGSWNRGFIPAHTEVECTTGLVSIESAPLYMLWEVKKFNPDIKTTMNKKFLLLIALVFAIAVIVPLTR